MVTRKTPPPDAADTAHHIRDSAQQIWLAGLGAFAKAQAEGSKAFESLVNEGLSMQRKTHALAEERMAEATQRANALAGEFSHRAAGQWDKLENLFEDRVAKALRKLGVPAARDIDALAERIEALSQQVERLAQVQPSSPGAPRSPAPARKRPAARKAAGPKTGADPDAN